MKKILPFLLLCCFALLITNLFAQTTAADAVILNRKLRWSDFAGTPDATSPYDAMTNWEVRYDYTYTTRSNSDTVDVIVHAKPYFKASSWVKSGKANLQLLEHEQRHYDLAIVCAETFTKTMASTLFFKTTVVNKIDSVFTATLFTYKNLQDQYDKETDHMKNNTEQSKWNKNIEGLMKSVSAGK